MRSTIRTVLISLVVFAAAASARAEGRISPPLGRALERAASDTRMPVWVYFEARPATARDLAETASALTPAARERRLRNRGASQLVDHYDLPLDPRRVDAVERTGARVRQHSRWLNAVSVNATAGEIDAIAALPFVTRLDIVRSARGPLPEPEPEDMRAPLAPRAPAATTSLFDYGLSGGQNQIIGVIGMHDAGYTGAGVLICMMDSGFNNLTHTAFSSLDVLITRDFVNGDSVVADEVGQMGNGNHGTQTLSVIAGFEPGELIGPAFGATFVLAKTENTTWERHIEEDAWIAAAEWADSIGVDIMSTSLTYSTDFTNGETSYDWEDMDGETTIIVAGADIAASRGILVVNSAGNDGFVSLPANSIGSPCDGDSVLCVGAVTSGGVRASFSSVGPSADGRIKPDVMAMGQSVRVASPFNLTDYMGNSGTSFACPLVAGAAALVMEARPDATSAQVLEALRETADRAGAPDREYGYGIIDAGLARDYIVTAVGAAPPAPRVTLYAARPNPFNPTTLISYELAVAGDVRLDVFDVRGVRVATLVDGHRPAGRHSVTWNARSPSGGALASGVYFYRVQAAGESASRRVVLLK